MCIRTDKAMGLRNLPSEDLAGKLQLVLAANIAADLAAWHGLLGLYDRDDLKDAESARCAAGCGRCPPS